MNQTQTLSQTRLRLQRGRTYVTRDGRLIQIDGILSYGKRPVLGYVGNDVHITAFYIDGKFCGTHGQEHPCDIVGLLSLSDARRARGEPWEIKEIKRYDGAHRPYYTAIFVHPERVEAMRIHVSATTLSEATTKAIKEVNIIKSNWRDNKIRLNKDRHHE